MIRVCEVPRRLVAVGLFLFLLLSSASASFAQQTLGLFRHEPGTTPGYALLSPEATTIWLVNEDGYVVHSWESPYDPGLAAYLLPNGNLLRGANIPPKVNFIGGIGGGGRIEEYDWDGTLVWSYEVNTNSQRSHHDFKRLPNGNTLMIVWEYKTAAEAVQAGRNPSSIPGSAFWPEALIEVEKTGPDSGNVVWEWHAWDHLIQDFDPTKDNYGVVEDHPELININEDTTLGRDWTHFNGVAYNQQLDQIVISVREFDEFWVIDHSTTTAEAAGHTGGTYGKGGDLLYRWGNPYTYRRGALAERRLEGQHDAHWIGEGLPGAGNIIVFNNGARGRTYALVDEITPEVDEFGFYTDPGSGPYGPAAPTWTYTGDPPTSFASPTISGAERMPNGNTYITEGDTGRVFEVTPEGEILWQYVCPSGTEGILNQGDEPAAGSGPALENAVFKSRKYTRDYPAFVGRDLTPQYLLEGHSSPSPVPDGSGSSAQLTAAKGAGTDIDVQWDSTTCQDSTNYHLLFGNLEDVADGSLAGADCGVGTTGSHTWSGVPGGSLFFVMVGVDASGIYESSWGTHSDGAQRRGTTPSFLCGVTNKDIVPSCP
jgi:hypothetical protein